MISLKDLPARSEGARLDSERVGAEDAVAVEVAS
jgi:hypothetical protein